MSLKLYISSKESEKVYDGVRTTTISIAGDSSEKLNAFEIFNKISAPFSRENAEIQVGNKGFIISITTTLDNIHKKIKLIKDNLSKEKSISLIDDEKPENTLERFTKGSISFKGEPLQQELAKSQSSERTKLKKQSFLSSVKHDDASLKPYYSSSLEGDKTLVITIAPRNLEKPEELFDGLSLLGSLTLKNGKWVICLTSNFGATNTLLKKHGIISEEEWAKILKKQKFLAAVKNDNAFQFFSYERNESSKMQELVIKIAPHGPQQYIGQLFDTLDAFGSLTLQEGKWVLSRQTENFDDDLTSITTILETMKTISEELMRKQKFLDAVKCDDSSKLPQISYAGSSVKEKRIRVIITPHNLQHAEELFDKLDVLGTLSLQDGKWFWECKTEDFLGDFRAIKTILQGYGIFDRDVRNPNLVATRFPATASD